MQVYEQIRQLQKEVTPDLDMYLKIINSLNDGDTIFTLADAGALRGKIGQVAEAMDMRSKRILAIFCEPGSREEALKKAIRLGCIKTIKDRMLSLPPLPDEEYIRQMQERRRRETEQRILTEQRMAMEAFERRNQAAKMAGGSAPGPESGSFAQGVCFSKVLFCLLISKYHFFFPDGSAIFEQLVGSTGRHQGQLGRPSDRANQHHQRLH